MRQFFLLSIKNYVFGDTLFGKVTSEIINLSDRVMDLYI